MVLVQLLNHRPRVSSEYAYPDLTLLEILGNLHLANSHKAVVPFIIFLNDIADFAAEEFVHSIKTAGHGGKF